MRNEELETEIYDGVFPGFITSVIRMNSGIRCVMFVNREHKRGKIFPKRAFQMTNGVISYIYFCVVSHAYIGSGLVYFKLTYLYQCLLTVFTIYIAIR